MNWGTGIRGLTGLTAVVDRGGWKDRGGRTEGVEVRGGWIVQGEDRGK